MIFNDDFQQIMIERNGQNYTIQKLSEVIDVSEQQELPEGSLQLTHIIYGFEVPIFLLVDEVNSTFSFCMRPYEGSPLMIPMQDDEVFEAASELLCSLEGQE